MSKPSEFQWMISAAKAAISKGHGDVANLRKLLIFTTCIPTGDMVQEYFRNFHHDDALLRNLILIALEGEDAGDAPWAAANTMAEFPAAMLAQYKTELLKLSEQQWTYLNAPAKKALAKIEAHAI